MTDSNSECTHLHCTFAERRDHTPLGRTPRGCNPNTEGRQRNVRRPPDPPLRCAVWSLVTCSDRAGVGGRGPRRRWVWWEALLLQWLSCWHARDLIRSQSRSGPSAQARLCPSLWHWIVQPNLCCRAKGSPSLPLWSLPYRLHFWNERVNPTSVISPNS